jgi:TnpA family transposase
VAPFCVECWEQIAHLVASVHRGHTSAIQVLECFGVAARDDPLYEALAQLGRLLRTALLADYFVNEAFRRELLQGAQSRRVRQFLEALDLHRSRGRLTSQIAR